MKNKFLFISIVVIISALVGSATGYWSSRTATDDSEYLQFLQNNLQIDERRNGLQTDSPDQVIRLEEESAVISVVEKARPSVVSIIITKELPLYGGVSPYDDFFQEFFGPQPEPRSPETERRQVGGGSGFIVSTDGYIVTNRHVVADEQAEYTVILNNGEQYEAKVVGKDPVHDIAVIKVEADELPALEFGSSDSLKVGQKVVAIGNALGEFSNTVSSGIVSGLSRSITAAGGSTGLQRLIGLIQTDASINPGNSGGPLLNLGGQVVGVNVAMAQGENIGFAIPVDQVKNAVDSVKEYGEIRRPWLGVRYMMINETIAERNNLSVDYGALIIRGQTRSDLAVIPGSPADKAGLRENDIILEVEGQKINYNNPLINVVAKHQPGDQITLTIMRQGEEQTVELTLEAMQSNNQ